jgi:hypothetical protein
LSQINASRALKWDNSFVGWRRVNILGEVKEKSSLAVSRELPFFRSLLETQTPKKK